MYRLTIGLLAFLFCLPAYALAAEPVKKTVAGLYQDKTSLVGKQVQLSGKIVKVNNRIMKRNFLHLRDGTGAEGTNNLTITSQNTANVGDEVVVTGTVALDVVFGGTYRYPVLLENAIVTKK